ncbi:MAG: hypothetical protein ACR2F8_09385 [Caulobacteraceae bacterium]
MPILDNPRHEAFCQARAKGFSPEDAYEEAGFSPGNEHAARLGRRPEVRARLGELRAEQSDIGGAKLRAVIATLLRLTAASEALESPAAIKEGRETLLEAYRLAEILTRERKDERIAFMEY